jgi:hypothetical protein
MDRHVTHSAGLIFDRLVVCWSGWTDHWKGMALQAQQIYLTDSQKARIGRSMRRMTGTAPLGLDRNMFEDEGTLLVGVALVTDRIAAGESFYLAQRGRSVDVVAVVTLNQPFINPMMVGFREVSFLRHVTAVTELRLGFHEQMLFFLSFVRRMAV